MLITTSQMTTRLEAEDLMDLATGNLTDSGRFTAMPGRSRRV
jgi:hypothetical protein